MVILEQILFEETNTQKQITHAFSFVRVSLVHLKV